MNFIKIISNFLIIFDFGDTKGVDIVTFNSNFVASNDEMMKTPNYLFGGVNGALNAFNALYYTPINDSIFIGDNINYSEEKDKLPPPKPIDNPTENPTELHTEKSIQEELILK